jgi:hypothetical protein
MHPAIGRLPPSVPIPGAAPGRIVDARLRTFATDPFEKPRRENDAWRATHEGFISWRQAISEPLGYRLAGNRRGGVTDRGEHRQAAEAVAQT